MSPYRDLKMPIFKRYKSSNLALKKDTQAGGFLPDLTIPMLKNLVLKTKILIGLFSIIFIGQVIIISISLATNNPAVQNIPKKIILFGPLFVLTAAILCRIRIKRSLTAFIMPNAYNRLLCHLINTLVKLKPDKEE